MRRISSTPGEKREDVAGTILLGNGTLDGRRHLVSHRLRAVGQHPGRGGVADGDGKGPPGDADDRGVAEEAGDRVGVHRRRHGDDDQVGADLVADLAEEGQGQVGMQTPLVELVEDHGADAVEERVGDELPVQDPLGHDFEPRGRADPLLEPDLVADPAAEVPPLLRGDPRGRRPRGDPAGLEEDQRRVFGGEQAGRQERRRDAGGLAGAGGGDQDQAAVPADLGDDGRQQRVDRQWRHRSSGPAGCVREGSGADPSAPPRGRENVW